MCNKEELLRQLIAEASVLTDEEVEEVVSYRAAGLYGLVVHDSVDIPAVAEVLP